MNTKIIGIVLIMLLISATGLPLLGSAAREPTNNSSLVTSVTPIHYPSPRKVNSFDAADKLTIIPHSCLTDNQVTSTENHEYRPVIAKDRTGNLFGGYVQETDVMTADIYYTLSEDEGQTWQDMGCFNIEGMEDFPALAYWGQDSEFIGTFKPDDDIAMGSMQYLFWAHDVTDTGTWVLQGWDWSPENLRDKQSPDIAPYSDVGDATWFYGVQVNTISSDYSGQEGEDIPCLYFADYNDETSGWGWWWFDYNNSAHAAVDIDSTNGYVYGVWDYDNLATQEDDRDILLATTDIHNWWEENWVLNWYTIGEDGINETFPDVGTHQETVMIVAQSDEATSQDIICYYSSNGRSWEKSIVADDSADELSPRIVVYGDTATCTFIKGEDLYYCSTEDGGATWSDPEMVNDNPGSVDMQYRTSDITDDGNILWGDNRNGNLDVYYNYVGGGPQFPLLEVGEVTGGIGVSAVIKNTGTAAATNVNWTITATGGIIGLINKESSDIHDTLADDDEITVNLGMIFGLGAIVVSVEVTCDEGISADKTVDGTQLIIFTSL